jgi:hypothetical protein
LVPAKKTLIERYRQIRLLPVVSDCSGLLFVFGKTRNKSFATTELFLIAKKWQFLGEARSPGQEKTTSQK